VGAAKNTRPWRCAGAAGGQGPQPWFG
jgi:hypothetical protein